MAASIRDVAKRAGVTHGTVSKVLGGNPKYVIPPATRERILAAVDDLGYYPHHLAQSLKRGRTDIYGFYAGSRQFQIPNVFIAHILDGLRNGCNDCEKDLLLVGTFRGADPGTVYGSLASRTIDGLVVFVFANDPLCSPLTSSSLPVVAVIDSVPNIPSVTVDEEMGAKLIVKHLVGQGHRRVVYCCCYGPMGSAIDRHAAFVREASHAGLSVAEFRDPFGARHSFAEFEAIMRRPLGERPTAVVCWHDGAAVAVISECSKLGISVPGDLAVIGYDGLSDGAPTAMPLTTIVAPWREVALEAVRALHRRIAGESVPAVTRLPVEFWQGTTG